MSDGQKRPTGVGVFGKPAFGVGKLTQGMEQVKLKTRMPDSALFRRKIWAPPPKKKEAVPKELAETKKKESKKKSTPKLPTEEREFLQAALNHNFLFSGLSREHLQELTDAFETAEVKKDAYVIQQGDEGDFFYVLCSGQVQFEVDGRTVGSQDAASGHVCFGELALLYSSPRQASVVAVTNCKLYRVDQRTFRQYMQAARELDDQTKLRLLKSIPVLQDLDDRHLKKLVAAMSTLHLQKDQVFLKPNEEIKSFYLIQTGQVKATDISMGGSKYEDIVIGQGQPEQSFGWRSIMTNQPISANVVALTPVTALVIDAATFKKVLGKYQDVVVQSKRKQQLLAITVLRDSRLDSIQADALVDMLKSRHFDEETCLYKESDKIQPALYLVRGGTVEIKSDYEGYTKTIERGGYFGDDQLLADQHKMVDVNQKPVMPAPYTVTVSKDCTLDTLTLEDCRKVMNTTLLGLGKDTTVTAIDNTIDMQNLARHTMLGAGSFGQVWLASYKSDNDEERPRVFALKVQSKYQLIETNQAQGVAAERNVMACLASPFIIRLFTTSQDKQRVYMLTSLLQGGELYSVIGNGLYEPEAKFYAAGILEGLTYMHRQHIIHRDLKPENVLINSNGYPVIIDLGFAKYVPDKTYTFCGTLLYIAPEVIRYKGHDKGADHWSWACMIYEMVTGSYPFYENGMEELAIIKKICRGRFEVTGYMSLELKSLLISMLVPDPTMRLGFRRIQDIYDAPWFSDIAFDKLAKQDIPAPWVPELADPLDSSNFADCSELEDKMKVEEPDLTEEQQAVFKSF